MHADLSWLWVSLPWATFVLGHRAGRIECAAPIASWARGKKVDDVVNYYRRRGARTLV